MAYQDTTYLRRRPALAAAALSAGWRSVLRAAIAFERQRRIRRAIKIVSALDDHLLKDIGVPRGSIPEEARKVVDRDFPRLAA